MWLIVSNKHDLVDTVHPIIQGQAHAITPLAIGSIMQNPQAISFSLVTRPLGGSFVYSRLSLFVNPTWLTDRLMQALLFAVLNLCAALVALEIKKLVVQRWVKQPNVFYF